MTAPAHPTKRALARGALCGAATLLLVATPAIAQPAAEPPSKAPAMPAELDERTYAEITRLTDQGQALFDDGKLDEGRAARVTGGDGGSAHGCSPS